LGGKTARRRHSVAAVAPTSTVSSVADERHRPTAITTLKNQSTHALFFSAADVTALRKKDDTTDYQTDIEAPAKEMDEPKEWIELRDLAQDIFHVYFSDSNDDVDATSKMRLQQQTKHVFSWVNGTMPSLPAGLAKLPLPDLIVKMILFIEASFRGIAQV
jgi:hypothetical protein